MNRKNVGIAATLLAIGLVIVVSNLRTGESFNTQALTTKQVVRFLIDTNPLFPLPPEGSCRDYLVMLKQDDEDGGRSAKHWARCVLPTDAGQDSGWSEVCHTGDVGEQVCEAVPPDTGVPFLPEQAVIDAERKCRAAARDACAIDAGGRIPGCVDEATTECLVAASEAGGVRWAGTVYAWNGTDPELSRIGAKAVHGRCACAPNSDLMTFDAGRCQEWQTWMGLDGGAWVKAAPAHAMQEGFFRGPACEPMDCMETEARAYEGSSVPMICRVPPDAAMPPDAEALPAELP